jgi:hypothetical protein
MVAWIFESVVKSMQGLLVVSSSLMIELRHKSTRHGAIDITAVAEHVDDCTIAASSAWLVDALKDGLHKHVKVTDLGKQPRCNKHLFVLTGKEPRS